MEVTIELIKSGSAAIVALLSIWLRDYYIKNQLTKKSNKYTLVSKSLYWLEIDKICARIKNNVNANAVYVAYFHNGGHFTNNISMDKFTVIGEDYNINVTTSYKKIYKSILVNYISYMNHRLLLDNKYYNKDIHDNDTVDLAYKQDLIDRNIYSTYSFLIKDLVSDKPIGFISIEYGKADGLNNIGETEVWKKHNELSKLLNMTVFEDCN